MSWNGELGERLFERQREVAVELARLKPNVVVAVGSGDIRAAKEANASIPIVMVNGGDAIGSGFVVSLARPGGNITGFSTLRPELSGKRLDILKEIVPQSLAHGRLRKHKQLGLRASVEEIELAAAVSGVKLQFLDIQSPKDFETAFQAATKVRAQAVLVRVPGPTLGARRAHFPELAAKNRLPAMYERAEECREVGGLMSYGLNTYDSYRRAATYVDKILKGRQARRYASGAADKV